MTREDLGLIRDMADRQLNLRLTRVIDEIRSAMRAYRLVDDEREGHPLLTARAGNFRLAHFGLAVWRIGPRWVSVKALESLFVRSSRQLKIATFWPTRSLSRPAPSR